MEALMQIIGQMGQKPIFFKVSLFSDKNSSGVIGPIAFSSLVKVACADSSETCCARTTATISEKPDAIRTRKFSWKVLS